MPSLSLSIFPERRYHNKLYRLVYCCREECKAELLIEASRSIRLQQIVQAAEAANWRCDIHGYSLCPNHKDDPRRVLSPQQKRAAYVRIMLKEEEERLRAIQRERDLFNKQTEPKSWGKRKKRRRVEMPEVEARVAAPAQNRAIQDKLDTYYDIERQHYKGNWNDQLIADQLKMPRIWITNVRGSFYGPEANDSGSQLLQEVEAYTNKCQELEGAALDLAAKFEELSKVGLTLQARMGSVPLPRTVMAPASPQSQISPQQLRKRHRMTELEMEELAQAIRNVILGRNQPMMMADIHKRLKEQNYPFFAINELAEKQAVRRILRLYKFEQIGSSPKNLRYWPKGVKQRIDA